MRIYLLSLMLTALALAGCRTTSRPPMPTAVVTPPPQERVSAAENPGSLFDPDGATMLFTDARAKRVGDVLLVKVVESTLSKSKAETDASRDSSMALGVEAYLGKDKLPLIPGATVGPERSRSGPIRPATSPGTGKPSARAPSLPRWRPG
jgi:flagellar L-ring protein FlgH